MPFEDGIFFQGVEMMLTRTVELTLKVKQANRTLTKTSKRMAVLHTF